MRNFIVQFKFENSQAKEQFKSNLESQFDRLKKHTTEEFTYYLIGEYNLPAVEDTLNDLIDPIQLNELIRTGDYVAVYFSDDFESDQIKRSMVFGKDEYIDNDIKQGYLPQHNNLIEDLLEYDFIKNQA